MRPAGLPKLPLQTRPRPGVSGWRRSDCLVAKAAGYDETPSGRRPRGGRPRATARGVRVPDGLHAGGPRQAAGSPGHKLRPGRQACTPRKPPRARGIAPWSASGLAGRRSATCGFNAACVLAEQKSLLCRTSVLGFEDNLRFNCLKENGVSSRAQGPCSVQTQLRVTSKAGAAVGHAHTSRRSRGPRSWLGGCLAKMSHLPLVRQFSTPQPSCSPEPATPGSCLRAAV